MDVCSVLGIACSVISHQSVQYFLALPFLSALGVSVDDWIRANEVGLQLWCMGQARLQQGQARLQQGDLVLFLLWPAACGRFSTLQKATLWPRCQAPLLSGSGAGWMHRGPNAAQ